MKLQQFIYLWVVHNAQILFLILFLFMVCTQMQGQLKYDIRLSEQYHGEEAAVICYEVQLKSASSQSWELAGQNYRLYYDASKATFIAGKSLLGSKYQSFKLVQDIQHIDASGVDGNLAFENDLGFLNYAIDLLNPSESGTIVPTDDSNWLATSEICFQTANLSDSLNDFTLVWARNGMTETYATSFVEISGRIGVNQLGTTQGATFFDLFPESTNTSEQKVYLKARVFLQGPYDEKTGLMKDILRTKGYIPLEAPYNNTFFQNKNLSLKEDANKKEKVTNPTTLSINGKNAIIDWVFLELRDKQEIGKVIMTRSALLKRDGEIVDLDGKSAVEFLVPKDAYYLVIRHRNHLGIMSANPINFEEQAVSIDFTNPNIPVYGENARKEEDEVALLWGGNADGNNYIVFQGGGLSIPDSDKILFDVFSDRINVDNRFNHIVKGYFDSDLNMDGEVRCQGVNNEIYELLFFNIFSHPRNTNFFSNFYIQEQIPQKIE